MLKFFEKDPFLKGFNNHFLGEINSTLPYYGPLMYVILRAMDSKNILEVGIEQGYTSYQLAYAAKMNGGMYYGIDIDKEWCDKIEREFQKEGLPHKIFNLDTKKVKSLKDLGIERIDFAFLDGEHTTEAVLHEIELIYPLLASAGWGYIVLHDIVDMGNAGAWLKLKNDKRFETLGFNANYGLGIARKLEGLDYEGIARKWEVKSHFMLKYEFLADMINRNDYKTIVEIGVNEGETTKYLLGHCKLDTYILVDKNFSAKLGNELKSKELVKECEICPGTIEIKQMDSVEISKLYEKGSVDLVFINTESNYETVRKNILAWKDKVREGGMLCGDNFFKLDKTNSEVQSAVKSVFDWINLVSDEFPDSDRCLWWKYM